MKRWIFAAALAIPFVAYADPPDTSGRCRANRPCDVGGPTVTSFTIDTDGTGNAELVLPDDSVGILEMAPGAIGTTEILDGQVTVADTQFLTVGAAPAATCTAGAIHIDTDENTDTNCTTTADNAICVCVATNTWVSLQ